MRAAILCSLALVACGLQADPKSPGFDRDLEPSATAEPIAFRPAPPPAAGHVRTGTIERGKLVAVLDSGPGAFLRQLEVTPQMDGERFVGWQLVQLLDNTGPLTALDVAPGDVLLAVNGQPLSRPDQLQAVWDSLRTANRLDAVLARGNSTLHLAFEIEPKLVTP